MFTNCGTFYATVEVREVTQGSTMTKKTYLLVCYFGLAWTAGSTDPDTQTTSPCSNALQNFYVEIFTQSLQYNEISSCPGSTLNLEIVEENLA